MEHPSERITLIIKLKLKRDVIAIAPPCPPPPLRSFWVGVLFYHVFKKGKSHLKKVVPSLLAIIKLESKHFGPEFPYIAISR